MPEASEAIAFLWSVGVLAAVTALAYMPPAIGG